MTISLRCAYCPYSSLHHDYIVNHVLDNHSSKMVCYGCLSKAFHSLKDYRDHLIRKHPKDPRAWGNFDYYCAQHNRTFLYFSKDTKSGKAKQFTFVADDSVNEGCDF
ncbi:hypothetical protein DASC09_039440 [Saccharomycopsis crataegensis]|uniref:C2H2-type domain-containing protein n=1 Tax=Saccharomycopsis crataegensis TaxID=43959 RepID=A0AAV5QPM0_9ASCO|nr:hypothetical protein DASC09_039440 [Saccharomycopsis crataegensis]